MINIFDDILKEGYEYTVEDAVLSRDNGILYLVVALNFMPDPESMEAAKAKVAEQMPGIRGVEIKLHYKDLVLPDEEVLQKAVDSIIKRAKNHWLKTVDVQACRVEENTLLIPVMGEQAAESLNKQVAKDFAKVIKREVGLSYAVSFVNDEEGLERTMEEVDCTLEEPPDAPEVAGSGVATRKKKNSRQELPEGRYFGREITGTVVPIANTRNLENGNSVIVKGRLFHYDVKTFTQEKKSYGKGGGQKAGGKEEKAIVTYYLHDHSGACGGKFFMSLEKWEELERIFKGRPMVKVRGTVEWDNFAGVRLISTKDMEESSAPVREDKATEKRVELHAHTKMSAMDGLSDGPALVKQALKWGHKAVAITDHGVVHSLPKAYDASKGKDGPAIKLIMGNEGYLYDDDGKIDEEGNIDVKQGRTYHIILLAKNKQGLLNLYKMVSLSHIEYFFKRPRLPRSVIEAHREGVIIGSACQAGEFFQAVVQGKSDAELDRIASFYDYLEVQPLANNAFMLKNGMAASEETLKDFNRKVLEVGKRLGKPVVATSDTHYINQEDGIFREVLQVGQGYSDIETGGPLFFRTTDEMLEEFAYLGEEDCYDVVIGNPNKIADSIEPMSPVPTGKFPPKIENAEGILRDTCEKNATEKYGTPLPDIIRKRLDTELNSIINNGYAVMYVSAKMLVEKSNEDGYIVGSRGSVGSSFAATMSGITEVNPLAPHYICPHCKHLEWGDETKYDCGCDMPEKACPDCGTMMDRDGTSIPFETFLGFSGEKEPDIDLNFSGEYQSRAQKYCDELFGAENCYKAGTISVVQEKTAYGFAKGYMEDMGLPPDRFEMEWLAQGITGVKRTTGQHAGGVVIVPAGHDINEFCPVQYPANKADAGFVTTHYDYHSYDQNLLKLDILGHEVPTQIRHLEDMTGTDPRVVPLNDPATMAVFNGTDSLNIQDKDYRFAHGSYGVPEFGPSAARKKLTEIKPKTFGDLVRISGLSHGEGVWEGNAQQLVQQNIAPMHEVIATRDDIMNYLIIKGVPNADAFTIMEKVRKGKGVTEEQEKLMLENNVPPWYIESCRKIKYMFPRAHAVAYTQMSFRIAYYKVHYPEAFYAVLLTTKVADFNWKVVSRGKQGIINRLDAIEAMGKQASPKDVAEIVPLELCLEMLARGYAFEAPRLGKCPATRFGISEVGEDGKRKVLVPLRALEGVGESQAELIENAYNERPFSTIEDLQDRGRVNRTAMDALKEAGVLEGMEKSDQISFF